MRIDKERAHAHRAPIPLHAGEVMDSLSQPSYISRHMRSLIQSIPCLLGGMDEEHVMLDHFAVT